jgi:hypothetical protein
MAENHLENVLKIMSHDDYDEETMRLLNIYVNSRGLLPGYYGNGLTDEVVAEVNRLLESTPSPLISPPDRSA